MILVDLESGNKFGHHDLDVGPREYMENLNVTSGEQWLVTDGPPEIAAFQLNFIRPPELGDLQLRLAQLVRQNNILWFMFRILSTL